MPITPDNFFRIEGWMRTELNLKGNELMAYALIYSFQTAYDKPFDGSQAYIAEWLGISRISVNKTILKLKDKGILQVSETRKRCVTYCSYDVLLDGSVAENMQIHCKESLQSRVKKVNSQELKKFTVKSKESLHKTDIETDTLNRYMKERGDATEFAPSPSPSNSVENSDEISDSKPKAKAKAKAKQKRFKKPTAEEIRDYCKTKDLDIDVDYFVDYYESNGWMTGKTHMKDWQATVRNWARREKQFNKPKWKGTNYGSNSYGNNGTTSTQDDYVSEYDYEPDEIIYT